MKKQFIVLSIGAALVGALGGGHSQAMGDVLLAPEAVAKAQVLSPKMQTMLDEYNHSLNQVLMVDGEIKAQLEDTMDHKKAGYVPSVKEDVHSALIDFNKAWVLDSQKYSNALGNQFKKNLWGRIEFYREALNWSNGSDKNFRNHVTPESYGYVALVGFGKKIDDIITKAQQADSMMSSTALAKTLEYVLQQELATTDNAELQYYMNEVVYFAATESILEYYYR